MTKNSLADKSIKLMSSIVMREQISNVHAIRKPNFPDDRRVLGNAFFIKISRDGTILEISSNAIISKSDAAEIIKKAINKSNPIGIINYQNFDLRYLRVHEPYGSIIVFRDKNPENEVLNGLIITFLIIGGVSLIMVFAISLFLANKALIPIKNAWEKQQSFVADASHELRTPLAAMSLNLEVVLDNNLETIESQSKWLENIQSEITRMSKLVEDLLFLARADSGEELIQLSNFKLSNALEQSVELFNLFATQKGILLNSDIQPNVDFVGNEGRIKQLVTILIDNAIKCTSEKGNIKLKMCSNESMVEIIVYDNGYGIPKENLNKIFERFYKMDKSRSGNYGGSGLGLSIANTIVKEHKGSISVSSDIGKGSTFKVTLPRI